ncbi:transcriptional regulator, TetR family [Arthrobacter sp. cf158]|uniref:TetR family transcriptional regulator n=1 Tax=Arthrobacter sp. cf158 TaxID=1761744 RepID=UPI0008956B54|nr:TetR family transcriptional regulator [Arthrobacter sp. cf158]SDW59713.1 transcriptional regulator, TetR family [Arthrobacter sp. cf158]
MAQRDAGATKARILEAAVEEFAKHGHAGGRIERISASSGTNVRMIYAYFGGKSGLFDEALAASLGAMAAAVPPRPEDLPGWAGDLFDYHQRDPSALRISLWAQLERPEAASEPLQSYLDKTSMLSGTPVGSLNAVDLLVVIYAVAQAWQLAPAGLLKAIYADPSSAEAVASQRQAVIDTVRRITTPESAAPGNSSG